MIELFISYLAHEPADTSSPLYLELNTTAMLEAQFGNGATTDRVTLYDANAQIGNTPYVKLSDEGARQRMATFLGGSYTEKQTLVCECVALGSTPSQATNRAELLKLAVEGEVKRLQSALTGLTVRTDLGGTASTESVSNIQIGSPNQEKPVDGQSGKFTATRTALIEIMVIKIRTR